MGSWNFAVWKPGSHFESQVKKRMFSNIYKVNDLSGDLVIGWLVSDLSAYWDIFLANAGAYLMDLRSRRSFSSPWYLMVGKRRFLRGVKGCPLKSRKNEISLEWMPGSILKLKSKYCRVSSKSNVVLSYLWKQVFRNEWNFSFMLLDWGCWGLQNLCLIPTLDVTFWKSSF